MFTLLQDMLQDNEGENPLMHKVFDLYLMFPQNSQSEIVQKHAFAALRVFITKVFSCLLLTFIDNSLTVLVIEYVHVSDNH